MCYKASDKLSKICYIGLGSNLNNPINQVYLAYKRISTIEGIDTLVLSSLYESIAMTKDNTKPQPNYINAVIKCNTTISPYNLLDIIKKIETQMGRIKAPTWASRIIDLDILYMEDIYIKSSKLSIPHPGLLERPFVLYPLAEIEQNLRLPNGKKANDYVKIIKDNFNTRILAIENRQAIAL